MAQDSISKRFAEQGARLMNMGDLYVRHEDGSVEFRNPDAPNRPFASRMEAQQYIDTINGQLQQEFQRQYNDEYQRMLKEAEPTFKLIQFAPKYEAMDETTRQIMDELIDPYAILDSNGEPVGFNCNLDQMHAQAVKLAKRFGGGKQAQEQGQQQAAPEKPKATQPAMDLPSSNGNGQGDAEPKSVAEAMKMIRDRELKRK